MFSFAKYGELNFHIYLCANCHTLYHAIETVVSSSPDAPNYRKTRAYMIHKIAEEMLPAQYEILLDMVIKTLAFIRIAKEQSKAK